MTGGMPGLGGSVDGSLAGGVVSALMQLIYYLLSSLSTILAWLGISFTTSERSILTLVMAVIILAALFDYCIRLFGKSVYNSIAGFAGLLVLHYLFGVSIPITLFTVLVVALFGVPGLLAIVILHIGGLI